MKGGKIEMQPIDILDNPKAIALLKEMHNCNLKDGEYCFIRFIFLKEKGKELQIYFDKSENKSDGI